MADPATLGMAQAAGGGGMLGTALGAGLGAYGALFSGQAESNMFNYRAGMAQLNKAVALDNANYARWSGEVSAQQSGMKTRANIGQATVAQAASGIDINRGSPAAVRSSMQELGSYDEGLIRASAARRAYGHELEAVEAESQTQINKAGASNARTASYLKAAGSILGGATSVSDKWLAGRSQGLWG